MGTPDTNCLCLGNLPQDTTDVDLYRLFAGFGAISAKGVRTLRNPDGSCKGFGFVNFLDNYAAQHALLALNGTLLPSGKALHIELRSQQGQSQMNGQLGLQSQGQQMGMQPLQQQPPLQPATQPALLMTAEQLAEKQMQDMLMQQQLQS